jgi:hypothetical protein
LVVARLDRARASASPAPPIGGPVRPADEDEAETPDVRSVTPAARTTEKDDAASDRDEPEDR